VSDVPLTGLPVPDLDDRTAPPHFSYTERTGYFEIERDWFELTDLDSERHDLEISGLMPGSPVHSMTSFELLAEADASGIAVVTRWDPSSGVDEDQGFYGFSAGSLLTVHSVSTEVDPDGNDVGAGLVSLEGVTVGVGGGGSHGGGCGLSGLEVFGVLALLSGFDALRRRRELDRRARG
jgi:hypothetical protein